MNAARRKLIGRAKDQLEVLKWAIETIRDAEQGGFDNMPEATQGSEQGTKAEAAIEALDEAISQIEEAASSLETAAE
jgi:hypothetical protein